VKIDGRRPAGEIKAVILKPSAEGPNGPAPHPAVRS